MSSRVDLPAIVERVMAGRALEDLRDRLGLTQQEVADKLHWSQPKIANYAFTTLQPNLGVVQVGDFPHTESFTIADLPGLIEGAHLGHGLGIQFLKHIERTSVIVHLVDVSDSSATEGTVRPDAVADFKIITEELRSFDPSLATRPTIVVATKCDVANPDKLKKLTAMAKRRKRCIVFLDEAQDLFMKRGGHRKFDDDTQNMLLAILDGVRTKSDAEIVWIVASNFNSESMAMDEAMLRRFQMKVDFRLPNQEERGAIIAHYLEQRADKVAGDLDLRHLVEITEGRSPADLETIVNQAGITAVQAGGLIDAETLMNAAERVLVGNVNGNTTKERERDRRIIAVHEWGHFLVDFELERKKAGDDWEKILAEMKTIKISLKANPRNNALGFVFHKQGSNLLKTKADIEHDVRVLLGGMANEELFFGEEGTTNGAHNDITRVTKLLHHAVAEMGMYRKTRLNFGALNDTGSRTVDEETRSIMELQSERLYGETKGTLARLKPLTEHLAGKLMDAGEMSLKEALFEIRSFEAACFSFDAKVGLNGASAQLPAPDAA